MQLKHKAHHEPHNNRLSHSPSALTSKQKKPKETHSKSFRPPK
jgi:hypothetical protein